MTGRARSDSDLDVAALTEALGPLGERADVVDLGRASSAIGFRAIREGRRAIERDRAERVRFEARTARLYDDEAPRREIIRRGAIRAARRLGGQASGRP